MTARDDIEAILRAAYAARVEGDLDGTLRAFADGVHFSLAGSAAASPVPVGATGIAAVRELMRRLVESFRFHDARMVDLVVEGEKAAVHWHVRVSAASGGDPVETDLMDPVEFRDGKIVSLRQFADTALASRLLGA